MCISVLLGEKQIRKTPRRRIKIKDNNRDQMKATSVITARTDAMTNDNFHQTSILLRYK